MTGAAAQINAVALKGPAFAEDVRGLGLRVGTSATGPSRSGGFAHADPPPYCGFSFQQMNCYLSGGLGLRSPGRMLGSVVGAVAADMMLVQCNSGAPIHKSGNIPSV